MLIQRIPDFTQIRPSATPARCFINGSPKQPGDSGVISTATIITQEMVGFMPEFSEGTVTEMAACFGMISASNAVELRTNNRRLGAQVRSLEKRLAALQAFMEADNASA